MLRGRKILICFLALTIILVAGCSAARSPGDDRIDPVGGITAGDYFPTEPGTFWDYQGEGNEFAALTARALHRIGNRAQFVTDNGTTLAVIYEVRPDRVTRQLAREDYQVPVNLLRVETDEEEELVILQAPFTEGQGWANGPERREIVANNARVTTPAGKYEDVVKIKITRRGEEHTVFEYYAPQVGLVKREFIAGEAEVVSELRTFRRPMTAAQVNERIDAERGLRLAAYQLYRTDQGAFAAALEATRNLEVLGENGASDQVVATMVDRLEPFVSPRRLAERRDQLLMAQLHTGPNVAYPILETVREARVVEPPDGRARVELQLNQRFSDGRSDTATLIIGLLRTADIWVLDTVTEGGREQPETAEQVRDPAPTPRPGVTERAVPPSPGAPAPEAPPEAPAPDEDEAAPEEEAARGEQSTGQ
ncbi:MAG: hypothetical protein U1D96_03825 [Eubacteriales bacterium]|jgi:hypothetical protein|nr:hypothetical protein [Pseudomonadota bacterium]MBU4532588.1 hypothetical protein [Bacillota bacterium]MBV1728533.1 hypothetical protein [Desulforudis sp.]MDQ7789131.1 hypothetical protein [Clostridia bacterium]MDZ4042605.1 hypothetical protein [Eubacteriales bacterium]